MNGKPIFNALIAGVLVTSATATACGDKGGDDAPSAATAEENVLSSHPPDEIGGDRPAKVVLPDDYDINARYPLVVMLHGYSANSTIQDAIFGMRQRAQDGQYVLILPEGTKDEDNLQFWNASLQCCDFFDSGVDDVAYLSSLVEQALEIYAVDPDHVAFAGHSNGGYMSYRMACERPDLIDAIAVLAGSVYLDEANCTGAEPVSVLHMHGTMDDTVPYEERITGMNDMSVGGLETVGAEAAIRRWSSKAGCDADPEQQEPRDYLTAQPDAETEVFSWGGCAEGIDVELWRMVGGDHIVADVNDDWRDAVSAFLTGGSR